MKLISWNVNGLRTVLDKGFADYFKASGADVLCLQETKCVPGDVQHVTWPAARTKGSDRVMSILGSFFMPQEAASRIDDSKTEVLGQPCIGRPMLLTQM
jgi:hypothetical protein